MPASTLTAGCPRCGAPLPLSLAFPEQVRCRGCGYRGRAPPEVTASLRAAAAILARARVGERQLSSVQARAMESSRAGTLVFLLILGAALLPSGCGAAFALNDLFEGSDSPVFMVAFFIVPCSAAILCGALVARWLGRRRQKLAAACAALAPEAAGAPCRCHVCGAELQRGGVTAIVRCGYCSADNFVDPRAVDAGARERTSALADHGAHVRAELAAVSRASMHASLGSLVVGMLVPPFVFVAALAAFVPFAIIDTAPDEAREFVVMKRKSGACVGSVTHLRDGRIKLYFGTAQDDEQGYLVLPASSVPAPVHPSYFVGKSVFTGDGTRGKVARVVGNVFGEQRAAIGDSVLDLTSLCVSDAVPPGAK